MTANRSRRGGRAARGGGRRAGSDGADAGLRPPIVSMVSLGCAKNTVDSERVLGMLVEHGFVIAADPDVADVVLVNTCAFIAAARDETERAIRELARARPVVALGCYAERYGPSGKRGAGNRPRRGSAGEAYRSRRFPAAVTFVPFGAFDDLPGICARLAGASAAGGCFDSSPRLRIGSPATAYLKIAEGCSNRCSYCAVPDIRGGLRSVPMEELVDEASELAGIGARELCVIAQDTASYGVDLYGEPRTHELLRKLCGVKKLRWVRLLYVHPAHLTDETLEVVAGERKMCRYLDLPVQHASDAILRAMGRRYDAAHLRGLLERTRERVPGIALRTSLIVGFPGEGRREFAELLDFVKDAAFDHLGAFTYSPEKGTPASRLGRRPSPATARSRLGRVMALQQEIAFARIDSRVGGTETVMLDLPADDSS
ncbi:MAG: MiaB/RimO family radical SAM methylthiotransferase, partial [Planctomycetota bacterium]